MLKLAICDDNRSDIELLESILDQIHYSFHYDVFFSAEELLQFQKEHGEAYHLYMFDIEMPNMTGLELAKEIRRSDSKALFVFLTSYTQYVMDVFNVITFDYILNP